MTPKEELQLIDTEVIQSLLIVDKILRAMKEEPERKITQSEVKMFIVAATSIIMGLHLQIGIVRAKLGLKDSPEK